MGERVKVAVADAAQEGDPRGRSKPQHSSVRVLAVTNADIPAAQAGGFDAVAMGET